MLFMVKKSVDYSNGLLKKGEEPMKMKILKIVGAVWCLVFLSSFAWSYAVLPDPNEPYVAVQYDDFYSFVPVNGHPYSAKPWAP